MKLEKGEKKKIFYDWRTGDAAENCGIYIAVLALLRTVDVAPATEFCGDFVETVSLDVSYVV